MHQYVSKLILNFNFPKFIIIFLYLMLTKLTKKIKFNYLKTSKF